MAKPCKYRLPGQDTWMSENEFKKSLADGLLDKFILDDKASIPSLRGFKADTTAAQKFRAPVAEAAPKAEEVTPTTVAETKAEPKGNAIESGADMLDKMSEEERDNFIDDWFNDRIPRESLPGGSDAIRFSEARKVAPKPMNKPKRLTMDNAFELSNFHGFVINIDGEIYGLDKVEDPDATSDAEDRFGDPKEYVWTYSKIKDGDNAKSVETYTSDINEVINNIKSSQKTESTTKAETKAEPTTKAEPKPTTEKVERKGAVEVEAETKRGTKVTYKAEISEDGKTASVQQTYEAPFGGQTEGPRFANLPVKTDANGNRYVETKNETRVYVDKVKEAPKSKEAPIKEEVEGKGKPTKVKIYAREPKLDDRGMPIISKFNQEVEFTKNKRTGKWETTDKAGNKIEATEDQAARADKALAEQPKKTTKEKISDAFDALKIDTKGKAFTIPIPPGIYNDIIEGAKQLVLKGVDVVSAIKQATSKALAARKLADDVVKNVNDYTNSKEFTNKVNEAVEGQERVSGIKRALTSKESQEIAEGQIERMTIKEALDAGEQAIKNGDVVPDKLITSIIGNYNRTTGQYDKGKARPLTAVETAAMVYYKTNLDNDFEIAYQNLNKAIESNNVIDESDARAEIARLEEKIAEYEVMANVTRYQQGLSLKLRSMMLNSEYDLVKQKAKIRAEYGGKIPADVEERLNELDKQLREANAKLAELEKKKTKTEDEEVVKNIKETKDTENKSVVSKDGKIKIPTADIRQAVLNGAATIDEVVDAVRDSVKAKFPKATDRQIRDAITNYGKSRTETKDAIQKKINEMKRVGRLLSELEDVQKGIKKTKNKIKRDALTEREIELKQKIKEELAKIPLTDEEIADLQSERLERFKKTSQKAIEELQKKIDNKDFDKKKRDPLLELDEEAAKLKAKREEVKFNFDLEYEKAQRQNMGLKDKFIEQLGRVLNAPKSLIASLDFSAPFRQGAIFTLSQNPIKTLKQIGKQFQFWWSENSYNDWLNGVKSSEYYPLLKASGLYIAEENAKLTAAEEAFMSNFMNKIPLIGKTRVLKSNKKLWGLDLYGRAERAYTGFLNNLRVQAFLDMAEKMQDAGISPKTNLYEFKSWADYVNNATGRGTGGKNKVGTAFNVSAPALSTVFFSPRFLWSRLNISGINPSMYYRMSPMARKKAIKRTLGFFAASTSILAFAGYLASLDDDDETYVEYDPRSSDFGKIRIGNTRIDILAGTQQIYRTLAQFATGEKKSTTTGEIKTLGEKYGDKTRLGVVGDFFANKFSPIMSTIYKRYALTEPEKEMRKEEGEQEADIASIIKDLTIPLYAQDIDNLAKEHGAGLATVFTLLSINGLGIQNFAPKEKSVKQAPAMDDFEKSLYEDDSYTDFEKEEQKMLEGF